MNSQPFLAVVSVVLLFSGYKARMRYEGFAADSSMDFWINLCSKNVYPVGWCAANGKPLVPPKCESKEIENSGVRMNCFLWCNRT